MEALMFKIDFAFSCEYIMHLHDIKCVNMLQVKIHSCYILYKAVSRPNVLWEDTAPGGETPLTKHFPLKYKVMMLLVLT